MKITELYKIYKTCTGVSTDSRALKGGELFFALKGENFDGNKYAINALKAGAAYAVVDNDLEDMGEVGMDLREKILRVEDSLQTLQELARWHRSMSFVGGRPLPVVALTGTNGKTTTKELIREVLSTKYNVLATEGNLNNQIGVPLTLLRITPQTEIAIIEMGASHPGDIKELVSIALPNYGLITNVGKAHLQGFGNFEGVMNTKGELYDYIQRTADHVFLNIDNQYLTKMASHRPDLLTIPYGVASQKVVFSNDVDGCLVVKLADNQVYKTHLVGTYNGENLMAAMAVGRHFGISEDNCIAAISNYVPSNNRSQLAKTEYNTLIIDAYNANPTSMSAALDNFALINAPKKVALLGDMRELGEDSYSEHCVIAQKALESGLDAVYFVGAEFSAALSGHPDQVFENSDKLSEFLDLHRLKGATILIKGSRGIKMEKCLSVL